MDKRQAKAIRMRILDLLEKDPESPEIERLGKLLGQDKQGPRKYIRKDDRRKKYVDPEKFIELRNEGLSIKEIAEYFKCPIEFLRSELTMLRNEGAIPKGATKRGHGKTRLTKEEYLEHRKTISSDTELAEKLGIHPSTIKNLKREWGVSGHYNKAKKITKEEYLELKKQGLHDYIIEESQGLTKGTINRLKYKWGLIKRNVLDESLMTKEQFIEYSAMRWSIRRISEETGLNKDSIRKLRRKWGLM